MQSPSRLDEVISKFPAEVRQRYDFSNAKYAGALVPITGIVCAKHGPFKQYAAQLRKGGAGCPACGDEVRRAKSRLTQEEFVARSTALHNGFYSYDNAKIKLTNVHLAVTCPLHGDFQITPNNHMRGKGCPVCGEAKRGHRKDPAAACRVGADNMIAKHALKFVEQAREVHGEAYDYSKVSYAGRKAKITIICPEHGPFEQTPGHHLSREHGCPGCSHHRSKGEAALVKFVSAFTTPVVRDRSILGGKELDIYLPDQKLAIEYCGDYWHAVKSEEEEKLTWRRHYDKYDACQKRGIHLLTIFESEWLRSPKIVKRLIRNAMGKNRGSIMARKCEVERVDHYQAAQFFKRYHIQGSGGTGEHYALTYKGRIVACMRFSFGANDRGANNNRMWTLSRYATRIHVTGGASRLLSAFRADHPDVDIKSFSDNRFFGGGVYEELGFKLDAKMAPDYQVWHIKTGLLSKAAWQRRNIPLRIKDIGADETYDPDPAKDPRTETEMTYLLGARRLFDCGKKRWVLSA